MQAASGLAVAADENRSALAAQVAKRRHAIRRQCDQLSEVSSPLLSALDQLSPLMSIMSEPTYAVSAEPCPRTTAEGENKFWALLESAPAAMVIANQDGIIVLANIQTQKLFGYSREELQGQNVDTLVPERFRGSVTVRLSVARSNDKRCVSIAVRDTGIGIKEEDRSSLFEAFKQLRSTPGRSAEGCGLGLHLSQRLAALRGGEITVQSQFGVGSTFTFALPG